MKINKYNIIRLLKHILFWVVYLTGNAFIYGHLKGNYFFQFKMFCFYMPIVMFATYFTIYMLLPRYLFKQKYFTFVLLLIGSAFLMGLADRTNTYYYILPNYYPNYNSEYQIISFSLIRNIINIYTTVFVALSIKLVSQWYQNQQKNQQLMKEKLESELKFLKSQIHPHFLFNTLNNLYALTLKKSDIAPEVVLKLSELLNYMLYECNSKSVALEKEINLIKDYIALEQLRYGKKLKVTFNVPDNLNNEQIAPMIILPFVENCFKHGVSQNLKDKWIRIQMKLEKNRLNLKIKNSKNNEKMDDKTGYSEGIGLKNVNRRLNLLYPEKYNLEIVNGGDEFFVNLQLELIPLN